nr:hypothetical protein [Eubacterium sp.]
MKEKTHKWSKALLGALGLAAFSFFVASPSSMAEARVAVADNADVVVDQDNFEVRANGNSIILEQGDDEYSFHIYKDVDSDGKIDSDDEQITWKHEVEYNLQTGEPIYIDDPNFDQSNMYNIYGLYEQTSSKPIRITVESGKFKSITGLYDSAISSNAGTAQSACTITVNSPSKDTTKLKQTVVGSVCAADQSSSISGNWARGVDLNVPVTNVTLTSVIGLKNGSSVTLNGETGTGVYVFCKSRPSGSLSAVKGGTVSVPKSQAVRHIANFSEGSGSTVSGSVAAIDGDVSAPDSITGDVDITVSTATLTNDKGTT